MTIDFEYIKKNLDQLSKIQDKAVKNKDNFLLAAVYQKTSRLLKTNAEFFEKHANEIVDGNLKSLINDN